MNSFFTLVEHNLSWSTQLVLLARIFVATFCGALVGIERSKRLKEAGVRTHCLVACGAAALMILSKYGFSDLSSLSLFGSSSEADPSRIASQVVSGISFLGAGIIFKNHNSSVVGLTTAAGIWATAAIGMTIGAGLYLLGTATTILIVLIQILMHRHKIGNDQYSSATIEITFRDKEQVRAEIHEFLTSHKMQLVDNTISKHSDGTVTYDMSARFVDAPGFDAVEKFSERNPDILSIHFGSIS